MWVLKDYLRVLLSPTTILLPVLLLGLLLLLLLLSVYYLVYYLVYYYLYYYYYYFYYFLHLQIAVSKYFSKPHLIHFDVPSRQFVFKPVTITFIIRFFFFFFFFKYAFFKRIKKSNFIKLEQEHSKPNKNIRIRYNSKKPCSFFYHITFISTPSY